MLYTPSSFARGQHSLPLAGETYEDVKEWLALVKVRIEIQPQEPIDDATPLLPFNGYSWVAIIGHHLLVHWPCCMTFYDFGNRLVGTCFHGPWRPMEWKPGLCHVLGLYVVWTSLVAVAGFHGPWRPVKKKFHFRNPWYFVLSWPTYGQQPDRSFASWFAGRDDQPTTATVAAIGNIQHLDPDPCGQRHCRDQAKCQ